jgi:hypothetical protein
MNVGGWKKEKKTGKPHTNYWRGVKLTQCNHLLRDERPFREPFHLLHMVESNLISNNVHFMSSWINRCMYVHQNFIIQD